MTGKKISFTSKWGETENLAEMIPNIGVGIGELIKNSFDADAENVTVELKGAFETKLTNCGMMISDDGHGMTEKELLHFFSVGYSKNKILEERISKKGRVRTGGKGIGRFACKKIAKKATLVTKAKDNPTFSVQIDWDAHDASADLSDVEFEYFTDEKAYAGYFPTTKSCGTFLILQEFRERMNGTELQNLHRHIQSLVNPFAEIEDFSIDLRVPSDHKKWEDIQTKEMVSFAQYSFSASIDVQGKNVEWMFENSHPWSKKELRIKKSGTWSTAQLLDGEECSIKVARVWIHYLSRDSKFNKTYITTAGTIGKKSIDLLCGFKLYRGKHRVFPYGEVGSSENGDWLGLTSLRNNDNKSWLGHEQVIAAAEIDPTANPGIKDMANRTGLSDTHEKRQLIKLLRAITKKMKVDLCNPIPNKQPDWLKAPEFNYKMSIMGEVGAKMSILPSCNPSIPERWTIKPNLPQGILLDRKTGEINGVPTTSFEQQEFIITGENIHGKNDYTFWLQINPEVKMVEVEKEVVLDDEEIYVSDDEELGLYDSLIDYKVAIRSNAHTVQTCLDRLNKSQTTEQMRKELLAAKKAIEQMLETIEE